MNKGYEITPWWMYLCFVALIFWGGYLLKLWKKTRKENPNANSWDKATGEWNYLMVGIAMIVGGGGGIIICLYQDCVGHFN